MKRREIKSTFGKRVFTFSRWSGKGYSLFQSLKRVTVIATLAILYHLSVEAKDQVFIQDTIKTDIEVGLNEIEVNAQRSPVVFSRVARIITVIDKDEIKASPAESVQELLSYVQSVDIRKRGGEGVQADISIRGSSFDQVMILLNGIDITDPQTGHHNLNLPVSLQQIQRIEIIRGPASRVFGPNAFSGAINIITNSDEETMLLANISTGSFGYLNSGISGSAKSGKIYQQLSLNRKSSKGYIENTDFRTQNMFYNLNADLKGKLSFQLGITDKKFGANSFYTPRFPEQYEEIKTYFSSLKWETETKLHLTPVIFWRRHNDKFELFRNEAPDWYKNHNYHSTDVYGINLNSWFISKFGKTSLGVNFRGNKILSNVLGQKLTDPVSIKGENTVYDKSKTRNTGSVFLEQSFYSKNWIFSGGVMVNYISDYNKGVNFFPGLDITWNFSKNLSLYGTANKSLRMPTFTDLYYNGPTNEGNPELKPETAKSLESGVKYNSDNIKGNITVFYRNGKNIIDWVRLENENKWHTENLTELKSSGIEIKMDYYPQKDYGKSFFVSKISIGYLYNNLKKNSTYYVSNYALDNLKHKFDFSIRHNITKNLSAGWIVNARARNGSYTEFVEGAFGTEVNYSPFVLFNGRVNYSLNNLNFYVSVSNILNTNYFDIGNVAQSGRWIKLGAQFHLNRN